MKLNTAIPLKPFGPRQRRVLMYLLSFLIPFLVFVLACAALMITPFGDKHSLAITDAKYYLNGEMSFARLLRGQENLFFSFGNGLGGNAWSGFAWGGFTIGNLLSLFATLETIPTWFTWICGGNLSICGLTMYLLLDHVNGHRLSNLIFSTSYAFIGFNVVNVYQTGFVLGPELLPVVVLGLILLVRGKTPLVYILSLAFCTFFNFYFAFHLCVFSVVFLLGHLCVNLRQWGPAAQRVTLRWLSASIIGGLLGAPMWLPALKAFSGGGRLDQTGLDEYTFRENMPFLRIFSKLFTGANSTSELVNGLPNIFCGILVVALVILYFMNRRVDLIRRRAAGVVLAFYLLTFFVPAFTLLMHGGTHTNWFPYRYSYVFSFVLICLAVEEFRHIDELTVEETKKCGIVLLLASILIFSTSYEYMSGTSALLDLSLLFVMWLGFWYYKTKPDKAPLRTVTLLLLIVVCGNLYANFIISTRNVKEWELDLKEYGQNVFVSGALIDGINGSENTFFRMEKEKSESGTVAVDAALYNYNGVSASGPSIRMFHHKMLNRLGINWFDMRHWYSEGVPAATDSLLGLKYIISERNLTEEKGYENKVSVEGFSIYESPYFLPLSILSDGVIQGTELGANVFSNLNAVWKGMAGGDRDIFTEQVDVTYSLQTDYSNQSVTSKELRDISASANADQSGANQSTSAETAEEEPNSYIRYTFTAEHDGPIYMFDTSIPDSPDGLSAPAIRFIGIYKTGGKVEGKIPLRDGIANGELMRGYCANLVFAYADNDVLADYAKQLNERDITFNVEHENQLNGTFTAEEGQRILFTIPWDEGWTCYIDGQKVPIDKTWDLFMSVEAPEGQHSYEMKFFPAWLNIGLGISAAALVGLAVLMVLWKRSQGKSRIPHKQS